MGGICNPSLKRNILNRTAVPNGLDKMIMNKGQELLR